MNNEPLKGKILVVDDETSVCDVISFTLCKEGHAVSAANDYAGAMDSFRKEQFDVVIQDIKLGGHSGIDLLHEYKSARPEVNVVMITAYDSWDTTVQAMRLGAFNYIKKPFDNADIKNTVSRALLQMKLKNDSSRKEIGNLVTNMMVGNSDVIKKIHDIIARVAPSDTTVIIHGESGTGKELVARALHYNSPRVYEPFIAVNCGAFTETLLESELFGHVRGSFTGAFADKKGLIEVADRGTFFFDEISEISQEFQKKLLRLLEDKEFKPVGSVTTKKVDVRFIAATNKNLEEEVKNGRFREDLFYRLNVIPIYIPPLRARKDDIPYLAGYFLARYAKNMLKEITGFSKEAMDLLSNYNWPGNARELENAIQRAITICTDKTILPQHLVEKIRDIHPRPAAVGDMENEFQYAQNKYVADSFKKTLNIELERKMADIEKQYILQALKAANYQPSETAKLLGITLRSLRYKMKKYDLLDSG